ncbi:MAG: glycosyltransferase [Myxococcales bacterium]|nr:MAG: glycosyltransferase [Myxococcales bacterium]
MKKILLLTDVPPSKYFSGALLTDQLVRFLPKGSVACFSPVMAGLKNAVLAPDLDYVPIQYHVKPREYTGHLLPRKFKLGHLSSFLMENYNAAVPVHSLIRKAVRFGRDFGATAVWAIIQGQTMIRMARPVAEGLGASLYIQVWDAPQWALKRNRIDPLMRRHLLAEYERLLRQSRVVGAASWAMAEDYQARYGVRAVPLASSLDAAQAREPATAPHAEGPLTISLAGQIYAEDEWDALMEAIDGMNWTIGGRPIKVRLMGGYINLKSSRRRNIEYLGYATQAETLDLMADSDVLYCPYWFDKDYEEVARTSFPAKLTTYLASGRPVFFHGPAYASPARFIAEHDCGLVCPTLDPAAISEAIRRLLADSALYARLTANGTRAFRQQLTLDALRRRFNSFLEWDEESE